MYGEPVSCCNRSPTAAGIAAPPPDTFCSDDRSYSFRRGFARKSMTIVAIAVQEISRYFWMSSAATSRSQRHISTIALPW